MNLNGCHNRPPFREGIPVQDGYWLDGRTRTPRMAWAPFRMARDCQYSNDQLVGAKDPRCSGCRWKVQQ